MFALVHESDVKERLLSIFACLCCPKIGKRTHIFLLGCFAWKWGT